MMIKQLWSLLLAMAVCPLAQSQCASGYGFAYCPSSHAIYILNEDESKLRAIDVLTTTESWAVKIAVENVASNLVATNETLAFSAGAVPGRIEGYSVTNGRRIWSVSSKTMELASGPRTILADRGDDWGGAMAINPATGKVTWKYVPKKRMFVRFLASSASVVLTDQFAIRPENGRVLKRWDLTGRVTTAVFSGGAPVLGTSQGSIAKYSAKDFRFLWSQSLFPKQSVSALAADTAHIAVISYNTPEYFRPGIASFRMLTAEGKSLWEREISVEGQLLPSSAAIAGNVLLFIKRDASRSSVLGLDAATGEPRWVADAGTRRLREGIVCDPERCLIGAEDGNVFVVNLRAGAGSWLLSKGTSRSSPTTR